MLKFMDLKASTVDLDEPSHHLEPFPLDLHSLQIQTLLCLAL